MDVSGCEASGSSLLGAELALLVGAGGGGQPPSPSPLSGARGHLLWPLSSCNFVVRLAKTADDHVTEVVHSLDANMQAVYKRCTFKICAS